MELRAAGHEVSSSGSCAIERLIQGAAVRLLNINTNRTRHEFDADGRYHFFACFPAPTISVEIGFAARHDSIALRVGDRSLSTLALRSVMSRNPSTSLPRGRCCSRPQNGDYVVEQQKVVTLPLDARNFVPLIACFPGVMLPPSNLPDPTAPAAPGEPSRPSIGVLRPGRVKSRTFRSWCVRTSASRTNSYSAEYGRSNGGVIMVIQVRSNEFHGSLFEFFGTAL